MDTKPMDEGRLLELAAAIVIAHVSNNNVGTSELATLVRKVFEALTGLERNEKPAEQPKRIPAVSIKASIRPDYLVCLECGSKQKTLKRHLNSAHGLTARQYRADFDLPLDYPMVSSNYSKRRSEMAQAFGLGRRLSRSESSFGKKP